MRLVYFSHSLRSDWNHGNAHFLRGLARELSGRGHRVEVFEPSNAWSVQNLMADHGRQPLRAFASAYPELICHTFDSALPNLERIVEGADVVIAHEWNAPELIASLGRLRTQGRFRLLFHDTHHRAVTAPSDMARFDLEHYDGVLAFGEVIRDIYLKRAWTTHAWTWHEAADTTVFRPLGGKKSGDVVWIGNWGDGERLQEIHDYFIQPVRDLQLAAAVHGVRYPDAARQALATANIPYLGWLPNFRVPNVFGRYRATVHISRLPYRTTIPGVPTIRVFEALACGIPLVSLAWDDTEQLFTEGSDYLSVKNPKAMQKALRDVLSDVGLRDELVRCGRRTILEKHTCGHRVDELLAILRSLGVTSDKLFPKEHKQRSTSRTTIRSVPPLSPAPTQTDSERANNSLQTGSLQSGSLRPDPITTVVPK